MCLLYALSAWGGYISIDNVGRLNQILCKAKRYGFTDSLLTFFLSFGNSLTSIGGGARPIGQGGQLPAHFLLPMGKAGKP